MSYQMNERLSKSAFRILSKGRISLVVSGCLLMSSVSLATPVGEEKKWGAHIDIEGKGGTDRNLGEADLFLPLSQDARTLVFADIRTRIDDQSSREGNFGLGVRHMLESGWNLGGYGYFDRRRSGNYNYFNQVTLGAEALGQDWDFRANAYLPQGTRVRELSTTTGVSSASLSGASILVTTTAGITQEERSLKGFDAELGWRAPIFDSNESRQLRLYAGGYRFAAADLTVQGPRLRAELAMENLDWFGKGTALFLGAETQHDGARGDQSFVSIRLRIPLGGEGIRMKTLTPQERRMTTPVMRDVDIVTQGRTFVSTPASVETATATVGGQTITVLDSATTTTTAALNTALTTAGANTVILSGTFNTNAPVNMAANQTLIGGGSLTVSSPSGRTAVLSLPGATIAAATNSTQNALGMANNATLIGMTVTNDSTVGGTSNAVNAQGTTGVIIRNSTLTTTGALGGYALDAMSTTNAIIAGNTITANPTGAVAMGIRTESANNITIADNTITTTVTPGNKYTITGNNFTVFNTADSTGNVAVGGTCIFIGGAPTGSVGYANGTTCP